LSALNHPETALIGGLKTTEFVQYLKFWQQC